MSAIKPTALHELHGTGNATRMKARANEPVPPAGDIETPPSWLSEDQKADWIFAVKNAPAGVVFACDRAVLEVFIVAADHHRIANEMQQKLDAAGEMKLLTTTNEVFKIGKDGTRTQIGGGNIIMSPYIGIISSSGARMMHAAAQLGFTPASRPRLSSQVYDPAMTPARQPPAQPAQPGTRAAREPTGRDLDKAMGRRETLQ